MNTRYRGVMNTDKLARATFVLSKSANDDLAYVAARMGQSRSALVREVLEPSIVDMAAMLRGLPAQPLDDDLDLFRDVAINRIDQVVRDVKREMGRG